MFNQRLSVKNFNRSLVPLANSNRAEVKKADIPDSCDSKSKPNPFRKAISLATALLKGFSLL